MISKETILVDKWLNDTRLLMDLLDNIPMTTAQRKEIRQYLESLDLLFDEAVQDHE